MQSFNVVIAVADCIKAENLAIALHPYFREVSVARDGEELRRNVGFHRAVAVVADLQLLSIEEVAALCKEFAGLNVVCTHRVPDESLWMKVLAVGASDVCCTDDFEAIRQSLERVESLSPKDKRARAA